MFQKSEMWIISTQYSEFPHFPQKEEKGNALIVSE